MADLGIVILFMIFALWLSYKISVFSLYSARFDGFVTRKIKNNLPNLNRVILAPTFVDVNLSPQNRGARIPLAGKMP